MPVNDIVLLVGLFIAFVMICNTGMFAIKQVSETWKEWRKGELYELHTVAASRMANMVSGSEGTASRKVIKVRTGGSGVSWGIPVRVGGLPRTNW